MAISVALGLLIPGVAEVGSALMTPCLIVLLWATFLDIPFTALASGLRDRRFLTAVLVTNFLIVPLLVFGLSRLLPAGSPLLIPVVVVLLAPCIDYVVAFTRLASGAHEKLLSVTPVLFLAQLAFLPLYVWLILGPSTASALDPWPFLEAVLLYLVLPLTAALIFRSLSKKAEAVRRFQQAMIGSIDIIMVVTVGVIVAANIREVAGHLGDLARAGLIFLVFAVVMVAVTVLLARVSRLDLADSRALMFSGVTRNSLVILPFVIAVTGRGIGPAVVILQTLVELLILTVLVTLVVRWTRVGERGSTLGP